MTKKNKTLSWSSARNICIVKTLAKLGHYPTRKSEKEAWFLSPLRSETQASFSVSLIKNLWYDFGIAKGGTIIDLVMAINKCSADAALEYLRSDDSFSFSPPKSLIENKGIQIRHVNVISHPALIRYLDSRKIPPIIAHNLCSEVWYSFKNRVHYAIGLKNDAGGWELRNKYYKCSTSPKTTSSFYNEGQRLLIFEGMFDILSLKVLDAEIFFYSDYIVLNSLGNINHLPDSFKHYEEVLLFLDNDHAGRTATIKLLKKYPNAIDESQFYFDYKDLNNMLTHGRKEK